MSFFSIRFRHSFTVPKSFYGSGREITKPAPASEIPTLVPGSGIPIVSPFSIRFRHSFIVPKSFYGFGREITKSVPGSDFPQSVYDSGPEKPYSIQLYFGTSSRSRAER